MKSVTLKIHLSRIKSSTFKISSYAGPSVQAQLYNRSTRVLPRQEQSQKVVVQLNPDKNIWTPAKIIQCPANQGRSYSLKTIHGGVYTRNRRFIKPDLTAAEIPEPKPISGPMVTRPTRTIKKPDRLIESKSDYN